MLRIECYPVMDGLQVHFSAFDLSQKPPLHGLVPQAVWRTIPSETIEALGMDDALRDCFVDVVGEYPGLLILAMR